MAEQWLYSIRSTNIFVRAINKIHKYYQFSKIPKTSSFFSQNIEGFKQSGVITEALVRAKRSRPCIFDLKLIY